MDKILERLLSGRSDVEVCQMGRLAIVINENASLKASLDVQSSSAARLLAFRLAEKRRAEGEREELEFDEKLVDSSLKQRASALSKTDCPEGESDAGSRSEEDEPGKGAGP
jgi:hypothetical protein